jgi:putative intracellular protease/amidase
MSELAPHTRANREFFAKGCAPHVSKWVDWIQRGIVDGKIIDGRPYIDLNAFAASRQLEPPRTPAPAIEAGLRLLARAGLR